LLFYGPSGSGKKTLIMALLRQMFGPGAEKVLSFFSDFFFPLISVFVPIRFAMYGNTWFHLGPVWINNLFAPYSKNAYHDNHLCISYEARTPDTTHIDTDNNLRK
jgi:hypothetical protein